MLQGMATLCQNNHILAHPMIDVMQTLNDSLNYRLESNLMLEKVGWRWQEWDTKNKCWASRLTYVKWCFVVKSRLEAQDEATLYW